MRKRLKCKLIALGAALASLFILGGCKLGESLADVKTKYALTSQVTYYANGGLFEQTKSVKNLYYKADTKAIDITPDSKIANISLKYDGFDFLAWYHAETDENGEIVYADEEKTVPVMSDTLADFSKPLENGEHWTLVADWAKQARVNFILVSDDLADGESVKFDDEKSVANEELIREYKFEGDSLRKIKADNFLPAEDSGYTFVQLYKDKECTPESLMTDSDWPIARTETDVNLYAKYIKGTWSILETADDVEDMFGAEGELYSASKRYYQIADIDCADVQIDPNASFNCEWQGNGFKIKNLTVKKESIGNNSTVSFFGKIGASAKIENVTFEDINVQYVTALEGESKTFYINTYLLFESIKAGAAVQNVKFDGKMRVVFWDNDMGLQERSNIQSDGQGGWTGWQYATGDGSIETGAENAVAGFDVTGMEIEVSNSR